MNQHRFEQLAFTVRFVSGNRILHFLLDILEEVFGILQIMRSPEFVEDYSSLGHLGLRLFKSTLAPQNASVHSQRAPQVVWVVNRMGLGLLDVNMGVAEPALIGEQLRQG